MQKKLALVALILLVAGCDSSETTQPQRFSAATIVEVRVDNYPPFQAGGVTWDSPPDEEPDLFFSWWLNGIFNTTTIDNLAQNAEDPVWETQLDVPSLSAGFYFVLFDGDPVGSATQAIMMGDTESDRLANYPSYPRTIRAQNADQSIVFTLTLEWR